MDRLAIDLSVWDGAFNLAKLAADRANGWSLVVCKLTEGLKFSYSEWASKIWPQARTVWGDRYGVDAFRVPYHYLHADADGAQQATFFLSEFAKAQATDKMDVDVKPGVPFIALDVEYSGNEGTPKINVVKQAAEFVADVGKATGLPVVVYGGAMLRDLGIKLADIGVQYGWIAYYGARLGPNDPLYSSLGIDQDHLLAWQYAGLQGDGTVKASLVGYPHVTPAGNADISAIVGLGGGSAAMGVLAEWCAKARGGIR